MSFASDVKKELIDLTDDKACCTSAMLSGMLCFGGKFLADDSFVLTSESYKLLDFLSVLCAERYLLCPTLIKRSGNYSLAIPDASMLLLELGVLKTGEVKFHLPELMDDCCKRSFIKGAFLNGGTVSDPEKQNHLEFSTSHFGLSDQFAKLLSEFDIPAKTLKRKSRYVTYFKDNDIICDVLAIMGAGRAALAISETNISKSINNKNNRINNSENANYDKTVIASVKQIIAINSIDKFMGIESLPLPLRELSELRREKRDANLAELAEMLNISKSGVNHRMRKILSVAQDLTGENVNE